MSVRMKLTHSKTASRRAHHRAGSVPLVRTPTGTRRRHFMDPDTGMYRGKQIITVGESSTESEKAAVKTEASKKEQTSKDKGKEKSSTDTK